MSARLLFICTVLACLPLFPASAVAADDVPLYEYIRSRIDPGTGMLPPDAMTLPDEPAGRKYSRIRWVPGALEGLGTRHIKWDGSEKASRVARLLEAVATGNRAAEDMLYDVLRADDVVTYYNDALDLAAGRVRDPEPELHAMARRFAMESSDRGPVKFGIALLGSFGDEKDLEIVRTLALHDEFGLYAAEAIAEVSSDRQRGLYEMARKVSGWGRIEAVSRMVPTTDPTLRRWLLTEGFRNSVTPQYLAHHCAMIADLAGVLSELQPQATADFPLLLGAADLIQALLRPGPGAGFTTYAEAPRAAEGFLRNIQKRRDSVSFYLAAVALRDYVTPKPGETAGPADSRAANPGAGSPAAANPGADSGAASSLAADSGAATWEPAQRREVAALATRIVNDSSWRRHVVAAISDDATDLDQAEMAAQKLGIKTFDLHLRRLGRQHTNAQRWRLAFAAAEPDEVKRLVEVAQTTFGPRFADPNAHHSTAATSAGRELIDLRAGTALEAVLQGVARYPGAGMMLVESSLGDVDDRVRRAAVETLVRWGGAYLRGVSVRAALNSAAQGEADEALRARMVALLNLGTLP
jgi:hypothetical protein